ncbi:3-oxoacyl-[acyl-carrier-protein] synthase III C-terminal domain-containing protein [Streptomyces sp. WAC06614]|uniref:3-oxoacyl-[acyl-carrier-protein] synthase III C-terminal domain-containing protein n=1 Tax=Streptomyces sp. WAC06614 TaxID=2487416 RepID=UPI000F7A101F|nr:3-oxoacyl-[acyl-carrier-protein] synthase III C-terminal domain-containing protein [Streptomyces sp. WAC06614]RSS80760.1 3-oxoacyl-ACP synthase [Streptomyces sp. WAC06614]
MGADIATVTAVPGTALGIASFGYAFGEDQDVAKVAADFVDDPERVLKWGYRTFHRAAAGVTGTDLAREAAQQALDRAGLTADALDLVIVATTDMPEYSYWDAASALARELKIERTQTLWLNEGCGAGVGGLFYAASTLALRPEADTALFVVVNRVSEFHRNRMNVINTVLSDAAVAVVLRRDHDGTRWLASEQFTDPEYSDLLRLDFGGAVQPLPPIGWTAAEAPSAYDQVREQFAGDPAKLRKFIGERYTRLVEVVEAAAARAGVDRRDIDHVIYLNDVPASVAAVAGPLGVPVERTNADIALDHGHMGGADQLISLGLQIERGELAPGDLVALCGISTGRWAATLIRV